MVYGGTAVMIATSQLQNPTYDLLWLFGFFTPQKNMLVVERVTLNALSAYVCACCPEIDWHPM